MRCAGLFVMFLSGCGAVMQSDGWNHFAFSASAASLGTAATSRPLDRRSHRQAWGF